MTKEAGLPGVAVLRAVGLTRRYSDGPREVVPFEDLSLELMAGQSLAVIGPLGGWQEHLAASAWRPR